MKNSMLLLSQRIFDASPLFRGRAKLLALLAICAAGLPSRLPAQQWANGSGGTIYYNGGSVGVGTASPSEKLEVGDGTTVAGIAINGAKSGSYGAYIWGKAAGTHEWLV